ncbi:MAG TPA: hypothetical protein VHF06_29660 [Pseudonocardiaceae bacterium]|nr:hypothetical protein [Pseudonocardiaceae bacterium]
MTVPLFGDAVPDIDIGPSPGVPGEQWASQQFRHRNLRIGRNRTVHRTAFLSDERGIDIPAPDCHAGSFTAGRPWWKVYTPTTDRVDCGLCLDSHRGHALPDHDDPRGHQLSLDLGPLLA